MSAAEQSIEKAETQLKQTVEANKVHTSARITTPSNCKLHTPTYCHIVRRSDNPIRPTLYLPLRTTINLNLKLNPVKRTRHIHKQTDRCKKRYSSRDRQTKSMFYNSTPLSLTPPSVPGNVRRTLAHACARQARPDGSGPRDVRNGGSPGREEHGRARPPVRLRPDCQELQRLPPHLLRQAKGLRRTP